MQEFDLSQYDTAAGSEAGYEHQVVLPDGQKSQMFITMLGVDSQVYRDFEFDQARRFAQRMLEVRGQAVKALTPEEKQAQVVEMLAACTKSWRGVRLDGKDLPMTLDNARMLYSRFRWLREQLDQEIGDRANFLPKNLPS